MDTASDRKTAIERLRIAANDGRPAHFDQDDSIEADALRKIVLGLPGESGLPSVGLRLNGVTILQRLDLDDAMGRDGGPLPAVEFGGCTFQGGFSGANGHFSRLTFMDCTFAVGAGDEAVKPGIGLKGAALDSDFRLGNVKPNGADDFLWIDVSGSRIDGRFHASRIHLRAPPESRKLLPSDPPFAALDLSGAEVRGDFLFLEGSRSEGTIRGRGVKIAGDVWLSGAQLANPGKDALFFQGAVINGLMIINSGKGQADDFGQAPRFRCVGSFNMVAAQVRLDLQLHSATIIGDAKCSDLKVGNDLLFGAYVSGRVNLIGCQINGNLDLSNLTLAPGSKGLDLGDGRIGRTLKLIDSIEQGANRHVMIAARQGHLRSMPGTILIESLWDYEIAPGQHEPVQIAFLQRGEEILRLDRDAQVLESAAERFGADLSEGRALEYLRVHGLYGERGSIILDRDRQRWPPFLSAVDAPGALPLDTIGEALFEIDSDTQYPPARITACALRGGQIGRYAFTLSIEGTRIKVLSEAAPSATPLVAGVPRFEGAIARHPEIGGEAAQHAIMTRQWVTPETLVGMAELEPDACTELKARLAPHVLSTVSLHGTVDLENLSCDMLDDSGGRYWGRHLERIRMNHFVYNRASWEPPSDIPASSGRREPGNAAPALADAAAKDSLGKKMKRGVAKWIPAGLADRLGVTGSLQCGPHWTPWEIRRNWIFQQFPRDRIWRLPSPARYRIESSEYRSQPFEQAIKVARAEGREDLAIHFEILKRNIEWRLYSRRNWEWFAALGVFSGLAWLFFHRDNLTVAIVIGAILIAVSLAMVSVVAHHLMDWLFGHLRRPIRAIAALVVAFLIGWAGVHAANKRGMMVVDVDPVATLIGEDQKVQVMVIGSPRQRGTANLASNIPCRDNINEALYALDVLVPLIDLREESRCEIGEAVQARSGDRKDALGLFESLTRKPSTFWAVLKAIYAIAGWFLVSLSILTFAQITRARTDPS